MRINQATLASFLKKSGIYILDILFPLRCLGCSKKGAWICDICLSQIPYRLEQRCPTCLKRVTQDGRICFECQDTTKRSLDGIFVASYYRDTLLPHAIHTYKYRFIPGLSQPLGSFLVRAITQSTLPLPDAIIPVPLHQRRLRFRGFNQSELLARILSQSLTPGLEIPLHTDVLLRSRATKPQMKTSSREERLGNLKQAFCLEEHTSYTLTGKSLWLIDDVTTTGTTLEECAAVLKKHGAATVFGIVLAR